MHHSHEGHKCCCYKTPLILSGIIFALIALCHLLKVVLGWDVVVEGEPFPIWANILFVIIAAALAIWNFCACFCKQCRGECHHHTENPTK